MVMPMERLHNGFQLHIPQGTFPLSTDSMVLSHLVTLPKQARVLDLGSGCGTLGILLCADHAQCEVTGIELDAAAHAAALENIQINQLQQRMSSICADLGQIRQLLPAGSFTTCVSNPPYFSGGPASTDTPLARRMDRCDTASLFAAAAWALQWGGDFFLVQKPETIGELSAQGANCQLALKKLYLVRHRPSAPISTLVLHFKKGGKPGTRWEELCLFHDDGTPTPAYRSIYHL